MIDYLYNPDFWTLRWELRHLAPKCWLIPLIATVVTRHFYRPDHRRIIIFALFTLLMDHVSGDDDLEFLFSDDTNAPWYHLLTPVLFYFLTRFFTDYLKVGKFSWLNWVLPVGFIILAVLNALWGDGFYSFPSKLIGLYSLVGMLLVIGYFLSLLQTLEVQYLERYPMFWISSGLLIYFASNFLLWVGLDLITFDREFFRSIYRINNGATIFLNVFLTIAIIFDPKTENQRPTPEIIV